jgi:hypothetical protein
VVKKKVQNNLEYLLYINIAVVVVLLCLFNIYKPKQQPVQVLGTTKDNSYWEEMVTKHPTYIDAWIELGRIDKVKEIDPNYFN